MANKIYKFKDIIEAQHFLNGGVIGGVADVVRNIVGKTFTVQALTTTFTAVTGGVDGDQTALRFKDIKAQIEATVATVDVNLIDKKIAIILKTPTAGVTVAGTGTGNTLLGFQPTTATVGKAFAPPPSATPPAWTFAAIGLDNTHIIYTLE